jgi:phenylpropionate dioxygenase-like ring-hydroxylating dioxygenase large terminal subunit
MSEVYLQAPNEDHARLFRKLLDHVGRNDRGGGEAEVFLDTDRYVSPDRFAAEREKIFLPAPLPVAHADLLGQPGDALTFDALGVPALLMRDEQGGIGAFLNVCRHRAARLLSADEAVCNLRSVTCPYHAWTYGTDGALKAIPLGDEGFASIDRATRGLYRLPVAEKHGFIWMSHAREGEIDLEAHLGPVGAGLEAFGLHTHKVFRRRHQRVKANWKFIIDAFLETYHVARLHKGTLARFFTDTMMTSERFGRHICVAVGRNTIEEAAGLPPEQWNYRVHSTFVYYLYPNSIIVFSPDYSNHLAMYPQGPDETLVIDTMIVPHDPRDAEEEAHWNESFELLDTGVFEREDFMISERSQEGARAIPDGQIVLGRFENCIATFHGILDDALAG